MEPIRPILYNIHEHYKWAEYAVYVLGLGSAMAFAGGAWRHVKRWRLGQAETIEGTWRDRLGAFVRFAIFQGRLASDRYASAMHLAIFFGMGVLFLGTVLATLDQDVGWLLFDWQFLRGNLYLGYKLVLDLFGAALVLGLGLALVRRYALKPERLRNAVYPTFPLDSFYLLLILLFIAVTGLVVEAVRLAATQVPWAVWSPVGNLLAAAFVGLAPGTLQGLHFTLWSAHALAAFAFIALVPQSKAFHMLSSALSIWLRNLGPAGALREGADPAGVAGLEGFTWRQLLQFDACTWCGRCQDHCPAHASGSPLSPKTLILKLNEQLLRTAPASGNGRAAADGSPPAVPAAPAAPLHAEGAISAAELWACTTCRACEEVCPVFIEQPRAIIDLRRHLVSQGTMDKTLQDALTSLNRYGNSFNKSDRMRPKWSATLEPKVKDARKEAVDVVWFVGDYASYDPRVIEVTRATAEVFRAGGVDFGLLMAAERNSGNDPRRVGEEGLFEVLRDKNLEALAKVQWSNGRRVIVTTDPHSYNTLKHEYKFAGDGVAVKHYTELLDELITAGRLRLARRIPGRVTYHDPCYLGRYNGVYEAPRRVLRALGAELVEMPRNRALSFCCGAGGGHMWMEDVPGIKERPSESRVREAAALPGVTTMVVSCPKDLAMFRDAVKTTGTEGALAVRDLAELVRDALQA
jgi:Fe-S oxidoreductase